jgi:hypothetical protein
MSIQKAGTVSLLCGWVLRDGINKSPEGIAEKLPKRLNARESHSLFSSWMLDEGFGKLWNNKPRMSKARVFAGPTSSLSLMTEWVWNQGFERVIGKKERSSRVPTGSSSRLASSWLVDDGASRLPHHLAAANEISKRSGAARGNVAYSWLVSTGLSRVVPKSRIGLPTIAIAAGCCVTAIASGAIGRKALDEQRPAASSALARQNSTGAVAYLIRKVA